MCFHAELAIGVGPDGHIWTEVLDSEAHSINFRLSSLVCFVSLRSGSELAPKPFCHLETIRSDLKKKKRNLRGQREFVSTNVRKALRELSAVGSAPLIIHQEAHGTRPWISPLSSISPTSSVVLFLMLFVSLCFLFFLFCFSIYWQCKCKPSCDSYRRPSGKAFVQSCGKRNAELLNLFCMLWKKKKKKRSAKRWWCCCWRWWWWCW